MNPCNICLINNSFYQNNKNVSLASESKSERFEQKIDIREKVPWQQVEYQGNQACVDLMDKKPTGLFSVIEEECILPHGNDAQLLSKMHTRYQRSNNYIKPKLDPISFGIRHFAGEVISTFSFCCCYNLLTCYRCTILMVSLHQIEMSFTLM